MRRNSSGPALRLAAVLFAAALARAPARAAPAGGAAFLDIPVGGRGAALGGAYTALADDAFAPVWNPAGLAFIPAPQLAATHLEYAASIGYEYAGFARPLGKGGVGGGVQFLHPKEEPAYDAAGTRIGSFSSYYAAYSLAYGRPVSERLSAGFAVKLITARIADVRASAAALDLGARYEAADHLTFGAAASNLGTRLKFLDEGEELPRSLRLGAAWLAAHGWMIALEAVSAEADPLSGRAGVEWSPADLLALRAGYRTDSPRDSSALAGMTAGFGVKVGTARFDYAWAPMGPLGDTHGFSVLLTFGGGRKA
jgi:hypothetical protein